MGVDWATLRVLSGICLMVPSLLLQLVTCRGQEEIFLASVFWVGRSVCKAGKEQKGSPAGAANGFGWCGVAIGVLLMNGEALSYGAHSK